MTSGGLHLNRVSMPRMSKAPSPASAVRAEGGVLPSEGGSPGRHRSQGQGVRRLPSSAFSVYVRCGRAAPREECAPGAIRTLRGTPAPPRSSRQQAPSAEAAG